jgi:hypothetical protein
MQARAEDRAAISTLLATYNMAGDRLQLDVLASTFAEDGVLEFPGAKYRGRDAIRAGLGGGHPADAPNAGESSRPTFVRHHLTTSQIDFLSDVEAAGRTYFVVYTDIGADHAGLYVDRIGLRDDKWLVTHRRVLIDWVSAQSLFVRLRQSHLERLALRADAKRP